MVSPATLRQKDAYVYCNNRTHVLRTSRPRPKLQCLGLRQICSTSAPLPFSTVGALRSRNQAQFNPAQYLIGLAKAAEAVGALVFEETRVTTVEEENGWKLELAERRFDAENVVLATNLPIAGPIPYDERTRPRSHIAMAFRIDRRAAIDGMFIGIDEPTHSLRMGRDEDGLLLVALGPNSVPGLEGDVAKHFFELEAWTRRNFEVGDAAWRWVNEDYDSPDRLPFVGASYRRHQISTLPLDLTHGASAMARRRGFSLLSRFSAKHPHGHRFTIQIAGLRKNLTRAATANHSCIVSTTSPQAAAR